MNQVLTSAPNFLGNTRRLEKSKEMGIGEYFVEPRRFSDMLLRLYDAARSCTITTFQDQAMNLIAVDLPFDTSWWGRSTVVDQRYQVHCSHMRNLPSDVPQLLNLTDPDNVVARRTTSEPELAHVFGESDLFAKPTTAALADHMRVTQAMGIAKVNRQTGLASFLSVARHAGEPTFCEHERQLLQLLMPHLTGALDLCCEMQMYRSHHENSGGVIAMITTDSQGFLHIAESSAVDLLQNEWPAWTGSRLPDALVQHIVQQRTFYLGKHVRFGIHWSGEHVLLALRPRGPQDILTTQEFAVATAFSSGKSYKEVARDLLMAPATVRHHLRSVYLKLRVSDKAELAHKVGLGTC